MVMGGGGTCSVNMGHDHSVIVCIEKAVQRVHRRSSSATFVGLVHVASWHGGAQRVRPGGGL